MTNQIAIALGVLIIGVLIADRQWLQGDLPLALARQMAALVEWVSFWR
ncbi:hypothetical protein MLD63_14780 [Paracoccus sp. TK19116]|uniref:Glyceraldehyde-3-phosphate dehydrogenase n=1 Tax=Paracoccus albicereus TaxID=2922394 RepID=A0ABT1MXU0_9RHOB|nr:hypothetical protein [Paracoccus albicereus]MCQ0971686.1 hypothetical protein [Paracoccus albicereus]